MSHRACLSGRLCRPAAALAAPLPTQGSGKPGRRLREARGCGLEARAARPLCPPARLLAPQRPSRTFAPASEALGAFGWRPDWPQALTVNGSEAPVVRVLHMAPRRHDDKRRTAVRTRGAGPREGAVKGPAPISLFYRDGRGVVTERAGAEKTQTPKPHPRPPAPQVCHFSGSFSSLLLVKSEGRGGGETWLKTGLGCPCSSCFSSMLKDQLDLSLIHCRGTGNSCGRVTPGTVGEKGC